MTVAHFTMHAALLLFFLPSYTLAADDILNVTYTLKANGNARSRMSSATGPSPLVEREPQFLQKNVYPTFAAPPILSTYDMFEELQAWIETSLFGALLQRSPRLDAMLRNSSKTHLVFAPTIGALLKFVDDSLHIIIKAQEKRRQHELDKNMTGTNGKGAGGNEIPTQNTRNTERIQRLARIMGSTISQLGRTANSKIEEAKTSCLSAPVVRLNGTKGNTTELMELIGLLNRTVDDVLNVILTVTFGTPMFEMVLQNHIAAGSFPELNIMSQNFKRIAMESGEWIDISGYPMKIKTTDMNGTHGKPVVTKRLYKQIQVSNGHLVTVDHVLWPSSFPELLAETAYNMPKPFSLPAVPPELLSELSSYMELDMTEGHEPRSEHEPSHEPNEHDTMPSRNQSLLSIFPRLPIVKPFMPFSSTTDLIRLRNDVSIFSFLLTMASKTGAILVELSKYSSYHILAPTNSAFFKIARMALGSSAKGSNMTYVDSLIHKLTKNVTQMEQFADRLMVLWSNVTTLPSLLEVLMYHVVMSPDSYEGLVKNGTGRVLTLKRYPSFLNFSSSGIDDADHDRPPARPIASFATLNGYVTVIDRFLTPFDLRIAMSVIATALNDDKDHNDKPQEPLSFMMQSRCFPGSAMVRLKGGGRVAMRSLKAGHEVHFGGSADATSTVFAFSHKDATAVSDDFVTLVFANRSKEITLSGGHYIYANGVLTAACQVRVLDELRMHDGRSVTVDEIRFGVQDVGLYAPHSFHGDLVVDDVVVSSYSVAVHPRLAHWLLAPVRSFARSFGVAEPLGSLLYLGGGRLSSWLPKGSLRY